MCIVSAKAKLTKTKILSIPLDNGRHLMSYTNKAKNLSGKKNSMILPIPGKLNKEWFYDTSEYNEFVKDIERQANVNSEEILSRGMRSKTLSFEEFEVGFYNVVTTNDISKLVERLGVYGPEISSELINFFKEHYKGWNFVCCIFDGDKEMDAQPIMFEYEPFDYEWVYFPTMDSHTGGAPDLNARVSLDHTLITEQYGLQGFNIKDVKFKQEVPEILKRRKYVSSKFNTTLPNGDIYINRNELDKESTIRGDFFDNIKRTPVHPGKLETIS